MPGADKEAGRQGVVRSILAISSLSGIAIVAIVALIALCCCAPSLWYRSLSPDLPFN